MIDLYLKAESEQALIDAIPFARDVGEEGDFWIQNHPQFAMHIIGALYTEAVYDVNDPEVVVIPPQAIEGFHANLRCTEEIAAQVPQEVIVTPSAPQYLWFGENHAI